MSVSVRTHDTVGRLRTPGHAVRGLCRSSTNQDALVLFVYDQTLRQIDLKRTAPTHDRNLLEYLIYGHTQTGSQYPTPVARPVGDATPKGRTLPQ
jgi:hypothetical protein